MKIGKIILLVLGITLIALSVKSFTSIPGSTAALDAAIYLNEPVVLPENEGKLVVIHGDAEMTAPAYDEELGLTLNTIKAYRYAEEYKEVSVKDGKHTWDWQTQMQKTLTGEAVIGEFELDEKTLNAFPIDTDKYYEDFDAQEILPYALDYALHDTSNNISETDQLCVIQNGDYYFDRWSYSVSDQVVIRDIDKAIINERDGAHAYSYRYYDDAQHDEMTVVGIQQGNMLEVHEKIGPVVYDGVKTMDEIAKSQKGSAMGGAIAFLVIGLALAVLGLRKSKKKSEKRKNTQKRAER